MIFFSAAMRNEKDWMNYFSLHISMAKNLFILKKFFCLCFTKEEFIRWFFLFYFKFMVWIFFRKLFPSFLFSKHEFYVKLMDEALSREMKWVIKNLSNWWIIFTKMPVAVCMLRFFCCNFCQKLFGSLQKKFYFWFFVFSLWMLIACWFNHEQNENQIKLATNRIKSKLDEMAKFIWNFQLKSFCIKSWFFIWIN